MNEYQYEQPWVTMIKGVVLLCCVTVMLLGTSQEMKSIGTVGAGLVAIFLFLIPAYNFWASKVNERALVKLEGKTITPERMLEKERRHTWIEKQKLIQQVRTLRPDQTSIAEMILRDEPLFNISQMRVTWTVGNLSMPVEFAQEWIETYYVRQKENSDNLPADSDFAHPHTTTREKARVYASTIAMELQKFGVVKNAASRYPPKWLIQDINQRAASLNHIGLFQAIAINEAIYKVDTPKV